MPTLDIVIPAYNVAHCLPATLQAIHRQVVPAGLDLGVIVVDNLSSDGTDRIIDQWQDRGVTALSQAAAQNRSATLNAGLAGSAADYVMVLDADCELVGNDCLAVAAEAIERGVVAGFGYTTGGGDGFWGRYNRALAVRRLDAGPAGWTTACCILRRASIAEAGGFNEAYTHYGFEDRDLVGRLRRSTGDAAQLVSLPGLQAVHEDAPAVAAICAKMHDSGRYSSALYRRDFDADYATSSYARIDADTASLPARAMLSLLQFGLPVFMPVTEWLLRRRHMPLAIGRPLLQLCSALAYFRGTREREATRC